MVGCSYGKVNRTLIEGLKENMDKGFKSIDDKITALFNHQSTHIPQETVLEMTRQSKINSFLWSTLSLIIGILLTIGVGKLLA